MIATERMRQRPHPPDPMRVFLKDKIDDKNTCCMALTFHKKLETILQYNNDVVLSHKKATLILCQPPENISGVENWIFRTLLTKTRFMRSTGMSCKEKQAI